MPSFILMGSQFTSEGIILGQKAETITTSKIYITDTSEELRKKAWRRFSLFFILFCSYKQKRRKIFSLHEYWFRKKREKGEIFLYHQMNGAEYKWKVWRRNQICKFENVSFGFFRGAKGFGIALHGFILLLPKCDYLFHTWNHHRFTSELGEFGVRREKMTRESFLMSNISWKLFYFLGPSQTCSLTLFWTYCVITWTTTCKWHVFNFLRGLQPKNLIFRNFSCFFRHC